MKVKGYGNGVLSVCYSRDNEYPRSGGNNSGAANTGICKKINNDEFVIDLNDACTDAYYIKDCAPLYVSVEVDSSSPNLGRYDMCRGMCLKNLICICKQQRFYLIHNNIIFVF